MTSVSQIAGEKMHGLARRLFPLCRSISGDDLRATLHELQNHIPLELHEVPTGTAVLDWQVPKEWNIRGGRIEALDGKVQVDFADCNLHVVGYSKPIDAVVARSELAGHVHTLPARPDLVPYRTAYYADTWGFCIADSVWRGMQDPAYRVVIDSTLADGALTYGELVVPGREAEEVLVSVHCCHPSLANDNLSGIAVATEVARHLLERKNRLTYRFLFIPATIGSLTWLARNAAAVPRIAHGLVLSCVGDPGSFHYKQSRKGNAVIDRAVAQVLRQRGIGHEILPFSPFGYDERQYCSPGFDLPVGCFMRSPNGTFPEYHTSADNLDFITAPALEESFRVLVDVIELLERNVVLMRVDGRGEPQLGRRGLYRAVSGQPDHAAAQMALLWVLNLADGRHSLLDMAERSGLAFGALADAADRATAADLVRPAAAP
jgi:aminopeptidase-like protein